MQECATAKFMPRPVYRTGDITAMLNAFEGERPADRHGQRPTWNRWRTRRMLQKRGLPPGEFTLVELKAAWPELVDSMLLIDAYEDARVA